MRGIFWTALIGLACVGALAGCGNSSEDKPTASEVSQFKGGNESPQDLAKFQQQQQAMLRKKHPELFTSSQPTAPVGSPGGAAPPTGPVPPGAPAKQ